MPAVKRRYIILILLLLLLLLGWTARLQIAEFLITAPMAKAGLDDVRLDIQHVDLSQTQLSQLAFIREGDSAQLELNATGINISYQPAILIKKHIDRVEIQRLDLYYQPAAGSAEKQNQPQAHIAPPQPRILLQVLADALDHYLFFNELSIHQLTLNGEVFKSLDGKTLSLNSRASDGVLSSEFTFHVEAAPFTGSDRSSDHAMLIINRLSQHELDAELRLSKSTDKLPAKIKLVLQENEISGNYQLSAGGLRNWLQAVTGRKVDAAGDFQSAQIQGSISLNFENDKALQGSLSSKTSSLSYATTKADNISLLLVLTYSTAASGHKLALLDGSHITAGKIQSTNLAFTDSYIKLAGDLAVTETGWIYQGKANAKQLSASYQAQQVQFADIDTAIIADTRKLRAEGRFSPATLAGEFSFALTHDKHSSSGAVSIRPAAAIDLSADKDKLSSLLAPWPYALDLYTGKIKLSADASWSKDKDTKLITEISIKDSGGNLGSMVFSGLNFQHELDILPVMQSRQASDMRVDTIDSGVAISNISTSLAMKTSSRGPLPRLLVRQTKGEILGGSFTADDLVYDLNRSKNRFLIRLKNIDLAEVVKTQQLQNISASGRLDGSLPVEISKDGINIAHGGLTNQIRGGTIRYTPESGSEQLRQNPLTGITLDALRDFRYSDLQADVNYLPDGQLAINLELKGISPELDENRPVHLNINTEQNLVSLLKSLRFAQGLSDSIDDQVRRMYERSSKNK